MPLRPGKENIGANIKTEEAHGKPFKQAQAIALHEAYDSMTDQQQALSSELSRRSMARDAKFEESKHPRAKNGQFGAGGGGASKKSPASVPLPSNATKLDDDGKLPGQGKGPKPKIDINRLKEISKNSAGGGAGHHGTAKRLDKDGKVKDVKVYIPTKEEAEESAGGKKESSIQKQYAGWATKNEEKARKALSKDDQAHEYMPEDIMDRHGVNRESAERLHKEIQKASYGGGKSAASDR